MLKSKWWQLYVMIEECPSFDPVAVWVGIRGPATIVLGCLHPDVFPINVGCEKGSDVMVDHRQVEGLKDGKKVNMYC